MQTFVSPLCTEQIPEEGGGGRTHRIFILISEQTNNLKKSNGHLNMTNYCSRFSCKIVTDDHPNSQNKLHSPNMISKTFQSFFAILWYWPLISSFTTTYFVTYHTPHTRYIPHTTDHILGRKDYPPDQKMSAGKNIWIWEEDASLLFLPAVWRVSAR